MGILVEFNPDLALRNIDEFEKGNRKKEECIPADLKAGKIYPFLKSGQRNYWFDGELPLLETKGNAKLSRPIASILMQEVTHFKDQDGTWTKGKYKIVEVFQDDEIKFESYARVGKRNV